MEHIYVTDAVKLEEIVSRCRTKTAVAIDTEFARTNTYYPIVGLVQIYTGDECYLIDPLEVDDLSPLSELLADTSVTKVLHACSEDVEVFSDSLGVLPVPIFDTQIAGALLGAGFSLSYQNLVNHYLEILVPKEETRSDWLQRPLTESQKQYAALDVIHLLHVYERQKSLLEESGRGRWVEEECANLAKDIPTQINPEAYYKKVKNLWRLDARQLYLLKSLCAWRERTARERNLPRNRIVDEKALYQIALLGLQDQKAFRDKAEVTARQLRYHGDALEELIANAAQASEDVLPDVVQKSNTPINSKLLRSLKDRIEHLAKDLNVAPEMLAKRRHLEQLLRSEDDSGQFHLPDAFSGWRHDVVGHLLLAEVSK